MREGFGRYAKREYERRWLLPTLPAEVDPARAVSRITDHYLDGTRFRLRHQINLVTGEIAFKLTQKFPEEGGAYDRAIITNSYLSAREHATFRHLPGRALVKCRHLLKHGGARYAIDVFEDALAGLILAERDYGTYDAMLAPPPPPFNGVEVTSRFEFTGGALAGRSFDEIRPIVHSLLAP